MATATRALGVEVIGASKSFGAFRALDDVTLKVTPGTVHALLGENGAGKSTLVKGLVGYGVLDHGAILADGRAVFPEQGVDGAGRHLERDVVECAERTE